MGHLISGQVNQPRQKQSHLISQRLPNSSSPVNHFVLAAIVLRQSWEMTICWLLELSVAQVCESRVCVVSVSEEFQPLLSGEDKQATKERSFAGYLSLWNLATAKLGFPCKETVGKLHLVSHKNFWDGSDNGFRCGFWGIFSCVIKLVCILLDNPASLFPLEH